MIGMVDCCVCVGCGAGGAGGEDSVAVVLLRGEDSRRVRFGDRSWAATESRRRFRNSSMLCTTGARSAGFSTGAGFGKYLLVTSLAGASPADRRRLAASPSRSRSGPHTRNGFLGRPPISGES